MSLALAEPTIDSTLDWPNPRYLHDGEMVTTAVSLGPFLFLGQELEGLGDGEPAVGGRVQCRTDEQRMAHV